MDTDAKNKQQNEKAEDELIRHLLLQSEAEEYREVLAKAPPAPQHSAAGRNGFCATPFLFWRNRADHAAYPSRSLSGRRQVSCWSLSVLSC